MADAEAPPEEAPPAEAPAEEAAPAEEPAAEGEAAPEAAAEGEAAPEESGEAPAEAAAEGDAPAEPPAEGAEEAAEGAAEETAEGADGAADAEGAAEGAPAEASGEAPADVSTEGEGAGDTTAEGEVAGDTTAEGGDSLDASAEGPPAEGTEGAEGDTTMASEEASGMLPEGTEGADETMDESMMSDMPMDDATMNAATKIQSMQRGKAARERVERIKKGDEDAFAEQSQKEAKRAPRDPAAAAAGEAAMAQDTSLDETGTVEAEESMEQEMEAGETDAQAEERRAKEERMKAEFDAKQMRIQERLEIGKKYSAALKQREELAAANAELQRRLAAYLSSKKSEDAAQAPPEESADQSTVDLEQRYFTALRQVAENRTELEKAQLNYDHVALDMKTRLEQKQEKVKELRESYMKLKTEIASGAATGGSGRVIPPKLLKQFEEQEQKKEQDLEKVRLKNIHLRNQLRKLEGNLRRKEELSNELHLIDFEQLKIENQTLNEKIEERNEELLKLRKKTTTTVQVLTHLKEKLQFVQAENQLLKVELAELEAELSTHRDALTKAKHDRDTLRSENLRLRGEAGLIGNNDLLRDFDRRKKEIASMQVTLESLKSRHKNLREQINSLNASGSMDQTR